MSGLLAPGAQATKMCGIFVFGWLLIAVVIWALLTKGPQEW
jgi:hypothetical protein